MTDAERIAELQDQLAYAHLRLSVATEGEALAQAALAVARQQAAVTQTTLFEDDMDAANEPEPVDTRPVMPARALRRQHAPVGVWTPMDAWRLP